MCCACFLTGVFLMLNFCSVLTQPTWKHGRRALMLEPPQRSSLWRYGRDTPLNINDSALNCGGFERQWVQNNGACGICGDPADGVQDHDENGIYDSNIIVKKYTEGGYVNVTVEVESNMLGFFEFKLCERNFPDAPLTENCFDKNPLWIEESWDNKYYIGSHGGIYDIHIRLPENVVCSHCVLRWKYSTGHRMGGDNGCQPMGSGRQEQFYNCADVEIVSKSKDALYERPLLAVHENIYLVPHELTYNLTKEELEILKEGIRKITPMMNRTVPNTLPLSYDNLIGKPMFDLQSFWYNNTMQGDTHHDHTHTVPSPDIRTPPPVRPVQTVPPPDIFKQALPPPPPQIPFEDGINESRITGDTSSDKSRFVPSKDSPMYAIGDSYVFPVFESKTRTRQVTTTTKPVLAQEVCNVNSPKFHCEGKGQYRDTKGIQQWCLINCQKNNCVDFMCECGCHKPVKERKCTANGPFQMLHNMNEWCKSMCESGRCPPNLCNVKTCLPNTR